MNWISKILTGTAKKIPEQVDSGWAKHIEAFLAPLDNLPNGKGRSGLARDIFAYVLHGEPKSVLNEVSANSAIGEHLQVLGHNHSTSMAGLYAGFSSLPSEICLRWAYLLEASARSNPHYAFCFQSAGPISWAEVLILHASGYCHHVWPKPTPKFKGLTMECIEHLLAETGQPAATLLISAFATPVASQYRVESRLQIVSFFDDFPQALRSHAETIRPLIVASQVQQKLHVLAMLEKASDDLLAEFAAELCELGVAASKQVRAAAEPLICRCGAPAIEHLKATAVKGKPEPRVHALCLLWSFSEKMHDDHLRTFARETAEADKAPSVQALIAEWDSSLQAVDLSTQQYDYVLPEIDWTGASFPDISQMLDRFRIDLDTLIATANKQSMENHQRMLAQGYKSTLVKKPEHPKSLYQSLCDYIASDADKWSVEDAYRKNSWSAGQIIVKIAIDNAMTPVVLLKMLDFFGILVNNGNNLNHYAIESLNKLHRSTGRPTLLELQVMLEKLGYPASAILHAYCSTWTALADDWTAGAVWPFFAHNHEMLVKELSANQINNYSFDRKGLFRAIGTLPIPPAQIVNSLFGLALGSGKTDRPLAQAALENQPEKEKRIISALTDGKAETRTVAAQWLGKLRHTPAIPALEQIVLKEKNEVTKGAMLDALQMLGQPVEKYLDRDTVASEAARSLAKGLPKDLEWFPWSLLPEIRWADSGEPVPDAVLRWMIVQAVKQKSPEPNAVLRKYCAMFHPRNREVFGQFILETWLHQDIAPISADEAETRAAAQAQSIYGNMRQYPQYYKDDPHFNSSVEELKALYLPLFLRQPAGSAIGSKGLMAVAGACAAERAAAPVARYLKEYYGTRAAQGKALIAMLAWIEHPSATQLMLSIGSRFRTKSFQEEATRQAEALAERKGWTLAELADRTIPSAGFDECGDLELTYGQRVFKAKLLPDFKIELFNPEGKKIAALPEPRSSDDAELAKDAKKAFSAAKKEIKTIVAMQTDRLYEALCTERDWPFEDWNLYLNQHPVVRRLVQRLVWVRAEDGEILTAFRPLEDGTLTDCNDNEIRLPDEARIRIAHDSLLAADDVTRWQQHLIDYEITPLFQQLGKGIYALPAEKANADNIKDFEGYLIEAFALRGRALKLGYTRGPAEDGGWFSVYEKRFPTLGLVAVLEFTGNPLPEENRTVALLNLSFSSGNSDSWQRSGTALSRVPRILLSECYNDLRLIAAEGKGYDPEWQKKSEY